MQVEKSCGWAIYCNSASWELTSVQSLIVFQPHFFLTRVNRVNFVVTNVKVELRGTLVWFDSRIGLLQEKLQVNGWFSNFWHCMHASPNPACKSLWKLCEKTRRTSRETLMVIIDFVLQFNWNSCRKSYCFLREAHFDFVIIMVNHKDDIYWE